MKNEFFINIFYKNCKINIIILLINLNFVNFYCSLNNLCLIESKKSISIERILLSGSLGIIINITLYKFILKLSFLSQLFICPGVLFS